MKPFGFSWVLAGVFGAAFTSPAMSGPIASLPAAQLALLSTAPDEAQVGSQIVQVRFGRGGGYRGGGIYRHHGIHRGGVAYRRGARRAGRGHPPERAASAPGSTGKNKLGRVVRRSTACASRRAQ